MPQQKDPKTVPPKTITLPGIADIIKVPGWEDEAIRRERIERLKTSNSPVPAAFSDIPQIINAIDDAEDILNVATQLAVPILKKLPARWLPYIGWLLVADDILNVCTAVLSIPLNGPSGKLEAFKQIKQYALDRKARLERTTDFLNGKKGLGFYLQAGQVLDTVTGYGLQLGGLMGLSSEIFWGFLYWNAGAPVTIRLPPANDPLTKAVKFLWQWSNVAPRLPDFITEDITLLTAAMAAATNIVQQYGADPDYLWSHTDTAIPETYWPIFECTNPVSQDLLSSMDIPWSDLDHSQSWYGSTTPSIYDVNLITQRLWNAVPATLQSTLGQHPASTLIRTLMNEASNNGWLLFNLAEPETELSGRERWTLRLIEDGLRPPEMVDDTYFRIYQAPAHTNQFRYTKNAPWTTQNARGTIVPAPSPARKYEDLKHKIDHWFGVSSAIYNKPNHPWWFYGAGPAPLQHAQRVFNDFSAGFPLFPFIPHELPDHPLYDNRPVWGQPFAHLFASILVFGNCWIHPDGALHPDNWMAEPIYPEGQEPDPNVA